MSWSLSLTGSAGAGAGAGTGFGWGVWEVEAGGWVGAAEAKDDGFGGRKEGRGWICDGLGLSLSDCSGRSVHFKW